MLIYSFDAKRTINLILSVHCVSLVRESRAISEIQSYLICVDSCLKRARTSISAGKIFLCKKKKTPRNQLHHSQCLPGFLGASWPFGGSNEHTGEFDDPCPRPLLHMCPTASLSSFSVRTQDHGSASALLLPALKQPHLTMRPDEAL